MRDLVRGGSNDPANGVALCRRHHRDPLTPTSFRRRAWDDLLFTIESAKEPTMPQQAIVNGVQIAVYDDDAPSGDTRPMTASLTFLARHSTNEQLEAIRRLEEAGVPSIPLDLSKARELGIPVRGRFLEAGAGLYAARSNRTLRETGGPA